MRKAAGAMTAAVLGGILLAGGVTAPEARDGRGGRCRRIQDGLLDTGGNAIELACFIHEFDKKRVRGISDNDCSTTGN